MLPLTKQTLIVNNTRYWQFKINPKYYGLPRYLNASIERDGRTYYATAGNKKLITLSFREAVCFLVNNAVKPMFKY